MGLPAGSEWLIILLIAVLLFGVGRLGKIGGELGKGIREFRKGLRGDDDAPSKPSESAEREENSPPK
ncbi:MAG: twin-arginine translocase TatA/TatE family subunit [Anaerolineales bacterium]